MLRILLWGKVLASLGDKSTARQPQSLKFGSEIGQWPAQLTKRPRAQTVDSIEGHSRSQVPCSALTFFDTSLTSFPSRDWIWI